MNVQQLIKTSDINKELCRRSLSEFIQQSFPIIDPSVEYLHNWHIDCIAEYLEACKRREIKRLIINIPPRSLKSISVSVCWTAWLLGLNPSEKILTASYSQQLSTKHSLDTRYLINSDWYKSVFPELQLAKDENQKTRFETAQRGHRLAVSVAGGTIGEGGDILIVDDPHNPAQAVSEVQRKTALNWFDQSFSTRLNSKKNGVIVVVMQRLHDNDLTGHLKEKGQYEHLCLPAICKKKTIIQVGSYKKIRKEGELLHSGREGESELNEMKKTLGSSMFAGQYQQEPAPDEGNIFNFNWFKRYINNPINGRVIQSWDTAIKADQLNDFSVCTTWMISDSKYYLIDVFAQKLEYPELKKQVIYQSKLHNPDTILIEDKASGQSLIQDLRLQTTLPVVAILPKHDKITRASTVTALIESGSVTIPERAEWLMEFEQEIKMFPNGKHDDIVDSMTQFLNWIRLQSTKKPQVRLL